MWLLPYKCFTDTLIDIFIIKVNLLMNFEWNLSFELKYFFSFSLFRCPTSYERAQNTRLHR